MKYILTLLLASVCILNFGMVFASELSSYEQLEKSWKVYKEFFIQKDGRVIDFKANSITTSEGQSYALLRAVWINDRKEFDRLLNWTNTNLKIRGDNLYGWKWGENEDGQWKIIDKSSATDADQDIALALILASERWKDKKYQKQAEPIINDIWEKLVIQINGKYYLTAGDWGTENEFVKINPSYYAPYAYRIFAKYDTKHDWQSVVNSSYRVIEESSNLSAFYLPPDWCYINKTSGIIEIDNKVKPKESDYSYDAIRVHWRLALDYALNKDSRALTYLNRSTQYFIKYWEINDNLPASVTTYGIIREPYGSYAVYGALLPAIALVNEEVARQIYHKKIAAEFVKGFWGDPKDYYAQNIIWFGVALWNNIDNNSNELSRKGLAYMISK